MRKSAHIPLILDLIPFKMHTNTSFLAAYMVLYEMPTICSIITEIPGTLYPVSRPLFSFTRRDERQRRSYLPGARTQSTPSEEITWPTKKPVRRALPPGQVDMMFTRCNHYAMWYNVRSFVCNRVRSTPRIMRAKAKSRKHKCGRERRACLHSRMTKRYLAANTE